MPRELAQRTPNRGMEGLTITPDGTTLVGIMQSALTQADAGKPKSVEVTRIVAVDLRTKKTHEYAYVLDDPKSEETAVNEIAALSQATDVGPRTTAGTYDPTTGVRLAGRSLEAVAALTGAGFTPVSKKLYLIVSNDSDFGISDSTGDAAPFGLVAKTRPDGTVDDGQFLVIDRH